MDTDTKTVAVVGNGYSLNLVGYGDEIDEHDIVIRSNFYYRDMNPETTGIKTDIWSCRFADRSDEDEDWEEQKVNKIWSIQLKDYEHNAKWKIPEWAHKYDLEILDYPVWYYEKLKKEGGTNPLSGTITAIVAREKFPSAQIDIYGFDFFRYFPNVYHYDQDPNFVVRQEEKRRQVHTPEIEERVFKEWLESQQKISWYM